MNGLISGVFDIPVKSVIECITRADPCGSSSVEDQPLNSRMSKPA